MNSKPLKSYANEMPEEIRHMFKGLSNDERLGIIIALLKEGKLTFGQMKKKFGLNSSSLSNHLVVLQDGNLLKNFFEKKDGRLYSFYDVTDIPELLFDSSFDILLKAEAITKPVIKKPIKLDKLKQSLQLHQDEQIPLNLKEEISKLTNKFSEQQTPRSRTQSSSE